MTLLDDFRRHPRAAPLLAEVSQTYRIEAYSEHCIALVHPGGMERLFVHNLLELEKIARRNRSASNDAQPPPSPQQQHSHREHTHADKAGTDTIASLRAKIVALEADIMLLRERGVAAVQERNSWRGKAQAAEARLTEQQGGAGAGSRYSALKRLIARELHPDQVHTELEKLVREALFKRIWPMVERLDRGG